MTSPPERRRWTREESILALNLYLTLPFGQMDHRNQRVIELAALIGRTPSAVALKLSNFASLDPDLQSRGITGMSHRSLADAAIWAEFVADREGLVFHSEQLREQLTGVPIEIANDVVDVPAEVDGREREALVKVRVNQHYFRRMILARYDYRCCITGLTVRPLFTASHIVRWADAPELRMNPRNGLCLNALHDRAFDAGLLTISDDFEVRIDHSIEESDSAAATFLLQFDGTTLKLPDKFGPDVEFLRRHREQAGAHAPV